MKYCAFESKYGYNSCIRLGKIYEFTGPETLIYILEVNPDLIELSYIFRKFSKKVKYFLKIKKIMKRFRIEYLFLVETGQATWRQLLYYDF
tara:strand:- start:587 stop:859 length:273 start_codon:yes stop_codon:yes gene_type:complete